MQQNLIASLVPALTLIASAWCGIVPTTANGADDWPGWLGGERGVVVEGTPPTEWSEDTNVKWKVAVPGKGSSSPVVVDGTIYLTTAVRTKSGEEAAKKESDEATDDGDAERGGQRGRGGRGRGMSMTAATEHEFRVMALDLATGAVQWTRTASTLTPHEGTHADGSFATPTIAVHSGRIYASFGSFGIFAYDMKGELLWSTDLGDMSVQGSFGEGSSPVVAAGNVVILWGHEGDSFLVALDGATGEEVWSQAREKGTAWTTPAVARAGDSEQIIVVGTSTQAYDAETGELVWSVGGDGAPKEAPEGEGRGRRGASGTISTPLIVDGYLYTVIGGRRSSIIAMDVESDASDEGLDSERISWVHEGDAPGIPSPLIVDGTLYAMKGNSGILGAFDVETGERHYAGQRLGFSSAYASPVAAGGNIYLTGRDGTFEVVRAGETFESIAVNHLEDKFDATPAIIGDTLLLRGLDHLYCIAASKD